MQNWRVSAENLCSFATGVQALLRPSLVAQVALDGASKRHLLPALPDPADGVPCVGGVAGEVSVRSILSSSFLNDTHCGYSSDSVSAGGALVIVKRDGEFVERLPPSQKFRSFARRSLLWGPRAL